MAFFQKLNFKDRKVQAGSAIAFLLLLLLFWGLTYLGDDNEDLTAEIVGEINLSEGAKLKRSKSVEWTKARSGKNVRVGDSLFTNDGARAGVTLTDESKIRIEENSLVVFTNLAGVDLVNLVQGRFRLQIEGSLGVLINGQPARISGSNSEVEVIVDKDRLPQFTLVSGSAAHISMGGRKFALQGEKPQLAVQVAKPEPMPVISPNPPEKSGAGAEESDSEEFASESPSENGPTPNLNPEDEFGKQVESEAKQQYEQQLKVAESLGLVPPSEAPGVEPTQLAGAEEPLPQTKTGQVYNHRWTLYDLYETKGEGIVRRPPVDVITNAQHVLKLEAKGRTADTLFLKLGHAEDMHDAEILELPFERELKLSKVHVGDNFWAASFDKKYWSELHRFTATPIFTGTPVVPQAQWSEEAKDAAIVYFKGKNLRDSAVLEVSNSSDFAEGATAIHYTTRNAIEIPADETRRLYLRARIVNEKMQISNYSRVTHLDSKLVIARRLAQAKAAKVPPAIAKLEQPPAPTPERATAAVNETSAPLLNDFINYYNRHYSDSRVQVEVAGSSMYSNVQTDSQKTAPIAGTLGVRVYNWWNNHGFEGSLKTAVMALKQSEEKSEPTTAEARYHYRFKTGFPFNWARELQTSIFAGFEMYRNAAAKVYSRQYDLIKLGTAFDFPVKDRWDMGGELVYGAGLESSKKYEISGFFHYFLDPRWSLGAGYRLHLFQAGSSTASADGLLPYKEAYGEGYSVLRWNY
jgi:hypothetical protein